MRHSSKSLSEQGHRRAGGARIALCAPDDDARGQIKGLLTDRGHEIVDVTSSIQGLVAGASVTDPELVILVCTFEPLATSSAIRLLRASLNEVPLVIVASGRLGRAARKLVLTHADGLLDEADVQTTLVTTVNCVLAHQLCVPAALREQLAQPVLSYREKQVLDLVLAGLTNSEIASDLFLSESTVKSHLASSFRKLGVSSRAEAARRVLDPDSSLELSLQRALDRGAPQLV